ncbi:MAG: dockerin type I domain-containing protein, partial [Oscillospiraceae bacterium]|nr:dockerin type I domain-containing protein [Oscillospiraceae bacterium]
IFGEGWVTTANALEILRFVAGLEHDIRSQSAMAAADVNGDGKIDTADALEVLRIVAGLA